MGSLAGKSILVTGGASGIGRSAALLVAQAGASVLVADLNADACAAVAHQIRALGGRAEWIVANVAEEAAVQTMVARAVEAFGALNGACNAAGVMPQGKLVTDMTLAEWRQTVSVNLDAQFLCLKHEAPAILKSGGGSIVIVASAASMIGVAGATDYCASKAGILGLVRAASCELASQGVRVNAVLPGTTRTPMFEATMAAMDIEDQLIAAHPIGRCAEPDEIGAAIRFLLSDEASFITGSAMAVDGGSTSI